MEAVIYNRTCWVFTLGQGELNNKMEAILLNAEFSILGSIDHSFTPHGYTKIWLLGESHLAVHTFPEQSATYLELSSCVESKAEIFWVKLEKWLAKHEVSYQLMSMNINRLALK